MEALSKAIKYVLRGIVFAVYFPFYLLIRLISAVIDVLSPSIEWLFKKIIIPFVLALIKYIIVPVFEAASGPLEWLWKHAIKPTLIFLWKYVLYPVMYYGIYRTLFILWNHGLRWFWREVLLPVLRYSGIAVAWLFRVLGRLWMHIIYYPLRWGWRHVVSPAIHWMTREIIKPLLQWFRNLFDAK